MRADMRYPRPRGLRAKLAERVKAKVRFWIEGHQITYFDSPQGVDMTWQYPSYPPVRVMKVMPNDGDTIRVGAYTGIHYSAVLIPGGQHRFDFVGSLHAHVEDGEWVNVDHPIHGKGPITIGSDVFIGFEAVVSSGVSIGDGAVVAARAMVTRDVEPYSIVAGNPAKHVRFRFDEPTREALLRIRWWDWSTDEVARHQHQIHSPDVAGFVARHDPELGPPSCELCG